MAAKLPDPEWDHAANIVAIFSALVHGWQTNDFRAAADARDRLGELGVKVTIPRRRTRKGAEDAR